MGRGMREPTAVKVARWVLGRGRGGNTPSLFDYMLILLAIPETLAIFGFVIAAMILIM